MKIGGVGVVVAILGLTSGCGVRIGDAPEALRPFVDASGTID